ncbi:membrane protein [Geomonas limicola]|uniref:Membrane protein n=1 Tax=Geomonas limicola TaxID=2740186 RepID=A0A6V8NC07_9BACT|nr:YfhO family protein [Geomonas limicola]GFO70148.1 membrane protein [Geomonas limicola]
MTERRKDLLCLSALFVVLMLFYAKILFTGKVISAPDIINESYWGFVSQKSEPFWDIFAFDKVQAGWNIFINSGFTSEGGISPIHFLFWLKLIQFVFPLPSVVAWHIVLHLFFGATGLFLFCRAIGAGRLGSLLAALIFAIAPENATLINAGHVMKIATISYAPWAFYVLERGFLTRRLIFFLATGLVLALQFFNTHWQIAYYTCLCIGIYGIVRSLIILRSPQERALFPVPKLFGMNLVVLVFFLTTVSVGLLPLANWSQDTNRGVQSGANQGKGGLSRDEAMSWSLPPEEVGAFVIPGFFGLSRQEGGENPKNIASYYWGRMNFTQTASYMGLLPWLLVPLPLIFRRNRYTWLATAAIVGGVFFSMGKYSLFYNLLFDYFPGINRFRVPKMIMFIPVMGLGVLSAFGLDLLLDPRTRETRQFKKYLIGVTVLPVALLLLLGAELIGRDFWINQFIDMLSQPTRYQPQSEQLVLQRWTNLVTETGLAAGLAALFAAVFWAYRKGVLAAKFLPAALLVLFLVDVGRIDSKFLFTIPVPEKNRAQKTPVIEYLIQHRSDQYRVLPMDGSDPMAYVAQNIPVMFTSNAVQQRRWQEFLDNVNMASAMLDLLNIRYLVIGSEQFAKEKAALGPKFVPVFTSPDGKSLILENRTVLPKAWLVGAVAVIQSPEQRLGYLQDPGYDPSQIVMVESPPPIPLANPNAPAAGAPGTVQVTRYQGEHIDLNALVARNAILVLGEKYYKGWRATVDGKETEIYPVNHVLRGIYLTPGNHKVEFSFDPAPFKIGKSLTLASFALFFIMLGRELWLKRTGKLKA